MRRRIRRLAPSTQTPTLSSEVEQHSLAHPEAIQKQDDQLDVMASVRGGPHLQTQLDRADRLGHHFGRVPVLSASAQIMGQRASGDPFVQRVEASEETPAIMQESEQGSTPGRSGADLEQQLSSSKGGGNPLPEETRQFMEPRFGADFSGVRVHTGGEAIQMNQGLNAQAFTHGSDIFFNSGKFEPNSIQGKQLLAHELTHVMQQQGAERISAKEMDESAASPQEQQQEKENQQESPQQVEGSGTQEKDQDRRNKGQAPEPEIEDEIDRVAMEYVPPRQSFMKEDMRGIYNDTPNVRGEVGDSYELAKMRAVAHKAPEDIKKRVQDNYDGTFNITIFVRDPSGDRKVPVTQMVDGVLPVGQPGRDYFFGEQMVSPPEPEFWAMLVEKAYAMYIRGEGQVEGGSVARSLQMLTGMSEFPLDRFSDRQLTSMLSYTVNNRAQVNATSQDFQNKTQTLKDEASRRGLPTASRSNFKIERANGVIIIQNPYGNTLELSMDRFKQMFRSFTVR